DPVELVASARSAVRDEPIAVYEDLLVRGRADAAPTERAFMLLAAAAGRSAAGRHARARELVDESLRTLDRDPGLDEDARRAAARLVVAIALRAGDVEGASAVLLDDDDPLATDVAWLRGERSVHPAWPAWTHAVARGAPGAAIAAAL